MQQLAERSCSRRHGRFGRAASRTAAAPFLPRGASSGRLLMDSRRASRTARVPIGRGDKRRLRDYREHPTVSLKEFRERTMRSFMRSRTRPRPVSGVEATEGTDHDGCEIEGMSGSVGAACWSGCASEQTRLGIARIFQTTKKTSPLRRENCSSGAFSLRQGFRYHT